MLHVSPANTLEVTSFSQFLLAHHRWASRVGCAPSSVRRPSTFAFKPHLLWNLWANFNETWQKVSPMGRDYNLYKWRALVHWVHFGQAEQMCNCVYIAICLKRHLLWSYWANFNETWQRVSPVGRIIIYTNEGPWCTVVILARPKRCAIAHS